MDHVPWAAGGDSAADLDDDQISSITQYVPKRSAQIIAWLSSLTADWQSVHAIDLHDSDRDSALALQLCLRSGLVQRRRLIDVYSEQMASIVIEATETGDCNERHITSQAAKLWPLANSVQGRPEWKLKLTAEGCLASQDIASDKPNARSLASNFATFKKAEPNIRTRIVGQGQLPPEGGAFAAAQATASIGNITIENHIVVPHATPTRPGGDVEKKTRQTDSWNLYRMLDEEGEPSDRPDFLKRYNAKYAGKTYTRGKFNLKLENGAQLAAKITDWRKARGK